MNKVFKTALLFFLLMASNLQAMERDVSIFEETKTDAYIVLGSASMGAVLGLSTLSFSSNASEDLNHIVVGSAIGIIIGVAIVAWRQVNKGPEFYEKNSQYDFPSGLQEGWKNEISSPFLVSYSFSF